MLPANEIPFVLDSFTQWIPELKLNKVLQFSVNVLTYGIHEDRLHTKH